jgi:hypothetical protein
MHKKSANYFRKREEIEGPYGAPPSGGEKASIVENGCRGCPGFGDSNPKRRIAHLLTMYGFIIFVVTTVILVFGYLIPERTTGPGVSSVYLGALMVLALALVLVQYPGGCGRGRLSLVSRCTGGSVRAVAPCDDNVGVDLVVSAVGRCRGMGELCSLGCLSSPIPSCSAGSCGRNLPICSSSPWRLISGV